MYFDFFILLGGITNKYQNRKDVRVRPYISSEDLEIYNTYFIISLDYNSYFILYLSIFNVHKEIFENISYLRSVIYVYILWIWKETSPFVQYPRNLAPLQERNKI